MITFTMQVTPYNTMLSTTAGFVLTQTGECTRKHASFQLEGSDCMSATKILVFEIVNELVVLAIGYHCLS